MANEKELNPSPKFPVGEKPELSPNPNFSDGLENKTSEKANTQIVNLPKEQEKRNLTVSEIIKLIQKYAPGFDPSSVEAGELISALGLDEDGLLKKQALAGLFDGKYVRVVNASDIPNPLTDEWIEIISQGVFVNGDFLGFKNPILTAYKQYSGWSQGLIISDRGISVYEISSNKIIASKGEILRFVDTDLYIKSKIYPAYPANNEVGQFICRKGTLRFYVPVAQDNITSGDTIALDSTLGKALIDHLDVVINGYMARYEYTDGNYVVYSSKTEADSGLKLQVNMISYNTTNGELSFNQMTFTPDN